MSSSMEIKKSYSSRAREGGREGGREEGGKSIR